MLEECRWVYNETLAYRKQAWEERQESVSLYGTNALLPQWKQGRPSLKQVHSQVLQNAQERVDLAYKAFFRRVKAGEKEVGYPRFRGYGRYDSMTYPQFGFSLKDGRLKLSKVGSIKIKLHRIPIGKVKTFTIRRAATGKWYASFSCETELQPLPPSEGVVGIDVGLESFATLSNGDRIANPRFFRKEERALAKANRRLSKETMGTPARAKMRKVVSRVHERIANRRKDFAHQLSRRLVNEYGVIAFEKLNVRGMVHNHCLSKSISDAAWSQLVQYTSYKAEDAGRKCVLVDPKNTSKMCSRCGTLVNKPLSQRTHSCPSCGLVMDRDVNAAINILRLGLQSLGVSP
jgi:putative transposase